MSIKKKNRFSISRREALASVASYACIAAGAGPTFSANTDNLHLLVADRARRLAAGPVTLKLLMPQGCSANVIPVIAAFRDLAGVDVRTKVVPVDEINSQLTLDSLVGDADYDLALPATFGIPDLATNDVILPITQFVERHEPTGFRDDILYSIGDTFDNEIYGFQTDGDTYVMFYQNEWLSDPSEQAQFADAYGKPLKIPLTWAELDRQMAFFHRPDEGRFGGALFRTPGYLAWEWWVRFHSKGIWPLSEDLEPQINSEAGVTALEDMIRASNYLYPQAYSADLFENWAQYSKGNIYCNIGWGGSQKYLNGPESKMRGRMAYGPTPSGMINGVHVSMPYFNWGWNYVVTASSKMPELAYLFALFASTSEMSTLSVREQAGYFDPFRPEHYKDPIVAETYSPAFLAVHEASLRASIPDLYLANQSEYFRILNKWLDAAIHNGVDPEEALNRAATQWSVLNLRAGRDAQKARWRELRSKYPNDVRLALRDLS